MLLNYVVVGAERSWDSDGEQQTPVFVHGRGGSISTYEGLGFVITKTDTRRTDMARVQVLPLPTQTAGAVSHTPFVLIIDQAGDDCTDDGYPVYTRQVADRLKADTGAHLVLIVDGELTVANVDEELHRAAQAAVERALNPERIVEV